MYRILAADQPVRERRNQREHPQYTKPELVATAPNQTWSWDITKLLGPTKWTYFYLYVVLDIFSRYAGWMVADRENSALAGRLIEETCHKQGVQPQVLTLHSDRGAPMTSKCTAQLLADLGVTRSLSRPQVSDDNPFSEAQFKTLKYHPGFPVHQGPSGHDRRCRKHWRIWGPGGQARLLLVVAMERCREASDCSGELPARGFCVGCGAAQRRQVLVDNLRRGPPSRISVIGRGYAIGSGHHGGVHQGPSGHDRRCRKHWRIWGPGGQARCSSSLERCREASDCSGEPIGIGCGAAQRRERQPAFQLAAAVRQAGCRDRVGRVGAGGCGASGARALGGCRHERCAVDGTDGDRAGRWLAGDRRPGGGRFGAGPGAFGSGAAMIPVPGGVRVWLATGATDMRRGMNTLALAGPGGSRARSPCGGSVYFPRSSRRSRKMPVA